MQPYRLEPLFERPLSLARLEIYFADIPQQEAFQSAIGKRSSRQALIFRWVDRDGYAGAGECSCRPDPYFSHEFLEAVLLLVRQHVVPHLSANGGFAELNACLAKIRGWPFAKGALLEAVFDLWRRRGYQSPLNEWHPQPMEKVPVGISLGLYDHSQQLIDRIAQAKAQGYRRIKLKIKPGLPANYIARVRQRFPDTYLAVDANGSFCSQTLPELLQIAAHQPAVIEQPFPPDRLDLNCLIKAQMPSARICLDESVRGVGDVASAQTLGILDEVNLKPGRVGGPLRSLEILAYCRQQNIPVWVGGMFESGIGRAANLQYAACLQGATAHDLSPSSRYFARDLVTKPLTMDRHGFVVVPKQPVEIDETALREFTQSMACFRPGLGPL